LLLAFLPPASQISANPEGRMMSITRKTGLPVIITCDIQQNTNKYIHWYLFQEGKAPRRLLYYDLFNSRVMVESEISPEKYHAYASTWRSSTFILQNLEESDSGVYYFATWIFGSGTKLIITDKNPDGDLSPKPTVFLPSIAETNLHKAGTHVCLLENFFPDVIKVYWKEKNGNKILESQQGDTMKTNDTSDTYMKLSWLTVPETSLDKEHLCVVKHESNRGGADQEILFPPVKKVCIFDDSTCVGNKNNYTFFRNVQATCQKNNELIQWLLLDALWLQFTNTSAYYTYLLLFLKSMVYFGISAFCLVRRTAACCSGKRC
uniref:Ig-like domain-containing protein n=1 Tax=Prolemur simus TaxID=1328070 RepID=A0A8C9DF50_PROSS